VPGGNAERRRSTVAPVAVLDDAWDAVTAGDSIDAPALEVTGPTGLLPSRLPVEDVAVACIATALRAASALQAERHGAPAEKVTLEREHVAAAVRSERYFRRGEVPAALGFAPLSRFWRTADGWVRTHANYPWHRAALLETLAVDDNADAVAEAIAARPSQEVEDRVFAAGGIAAVVRTLDEWRSHAQGAAVAGEPLIGHELVGDAAGRERGTGALPASGVRVLDLTRVLAGPICTRLLGALGAEVLRIDPPHRLDMKPGAPGDTLLAKRSALLDLRTGDGVTTIHSLLDEADVFVCGYRPGALDHFGLDAATMAARHPGVVLVYLDAWGHSGPWSGRRGFDSIVQAPSGIAMLETGDGVDPGALPCQLLDHGTGYLAAAAVLDGLRRQARDGGTHVRRLSLARTAAWLTGEPVRRAGPRPESPPLPESGPWLVDVAATNASVQVVAPPGAIGGRALQWPGVSNYGTDDLRWA